MLEADPLDDIRNIRKLAMVVHTGRIVDTNALPERPVFYRVEETEAAR